MTPGLRPKRHAAGNNTAIGQLHQAFTQPKDARLSQAATNPAPFQQPAKAIDLRIRLN
jgi:hypothetical protein